MMREWGRYLEDELVGVEMVIMNALTSGSIHLSTSSVRGRDAQPDLFATYEQAEAVVDSAWSPDIAFYVRQVPALRFDTMHGSVVVTDLWGETKYRALRGVKARPALRIHAPLMAVAERVHSMRALRDVRPSDVVVTAVGWGETEALRPRVTLHASSSYTAGDGVGLRREWIPEPNAYDRAGLRAVVGEFLRENDPTVVSEADERFQAVRRRAGVDAHEPAALLGEVSVRPTAMRRLCRTIGQAATHKPAHHPFCIGCGQPSADSLQSFVRERLG